MVREFNNTGDWTLPSVALMGSWMTVIILIGVFGNVLVIIVSLQGTRVRTRGKSLIVSMAFADMSESLNMVFMLMTVASYGKWIFGQTLCDLHGFINGLFVVTSVYSMMTISVNRYFIIVKSNLYTKVFSRKNIGTMIAVIWLLPVLLVAPPFWGWSRYDFKTNTATCTINFTASIIYSIHLLVIGLLIPLGIILFCCYKIFIQVRRHKTRLQGTSSRQRDRLNVEEIRITKTLVIIVLAYLICFIPHAIVVLIEMVSPSYEVNFWIGIISSNLIFVNHANNPIIYGLFNRQYRKAFKEILSKVFRRKEGNMNDVMTVNTSNNVVSSYTTKVTALQTIPQSKKGWQ